MKKKIVALCLVLALALTAVGGATLAYFTDTEEKVNTFTVGDVDITLNEEFVPDSQLNPGIDITKEATITNTGANPAWVWAEILIPVILDDGVVNEPNAPGLQNSLHFNYPGAYAVEYAQNTNADGKFYNADLSKLWIHKSMEAGLNYGYAGRVTVGDIEYNKYVKLYKDLLPAGETTSMFLNKVYMDAKVTQCTDQGCNGLKLYDGETCYEGEWELIVRAFAMQDEGFTSAAAAYAAYNAA